MTYRCCCGQYPMEREGGIVKGGGYVMRNGELDLADVHGWLICIENGETLEDGSRQPDNEPEPRRAGKALPAAAAKALAERMRGAIAAVDQKLKGQGFQAPAGNGGKPPF